MHQTSPNMAPVVLDKLSVVYDRNTGRVVHMHRVTSLKGGHSPSDHEIQRRALEHAVHSHKELKAEHLAVTYAEPTVIQPRTNYTVDLNTLQLVTKSTAN
jgi:hypothetical protein